MPRPRPRWLGRAYDSRMMRFRKQSCAREAADERQGDPGRQANWAATSFASNRRPIWQRRQNFCPSIASVQFVIRGAGRASRRHIVGARYRTRALSNTARRRSRLTGRSGHDTRRRDLRRGRYGRSSIMERMTAGKFRHMPVIAKRSACRGLISIGDVVKHRRRRDRERADPRRCATTFAPRNCRSACALAVGWLRERGDRLAHRVDGFFGGSQCRSAIASAARWKSNQPMPPKPRTDRARRADRRASRARGDAILHRR